MERINLNSYWKAFLPNRMSDAWKCGDDIATWLRANGHTVLSVSDDLKRYGGVYAITASGHKVYVNGYVC